MRVATDWRSASNSEYYKFCKKYPHIKLTIDQWRNIVYGFNEAFKTYILETGSKEKLPAGFGYFSINKKKSKKTVTDPQGRVHINLPVDWQKSKEKGKIIYNFNYHTEGYRFRWMWFKDKARLPYTKLWWFKATRLTSRLLAHYLNTDNKYQHIYRPWEQS